MDCKPDELITNRMLVFRIHDDVAVCYELLFRRFILDATAYPAQDDDKDKLNELVIPGRILVC